MKAPPTKKRIFLIRLLAVLLNPWFWNKLWRNLMQRCFPKLFPSFELYKPAPDASLVKLDGTTTCQLSDYIRQCQAADMPLVLNMGSYN